MKVFSDTTIIRSHVLISGFIDNYMIWNKHGEEAPPPRENQLDEILQDPSLIYCLMIMLMSHPKISILGCE